MSRFSNRHYQLVQAVGSRQTDDGKGPERERARNIRLAIHEQMLADYGPVTPDNAAEWIAEQERRIIKAGV